MLVRLRHWWQETRTSFWFVPTAIVLGAASLAVALIAVEASVDMELEKDWPLLFGAGAAGSRGLLTAVAGSMITVAGVVFSITMVVLSLTSSQYTSRVLRNFMRDRMNQAVLGVFLGVFAYCLVVLRAIRGEEEGAFVPSLAVLGGMALAFVGTAFLIYFIHHIALSIQASSIVAAAADETILAIDNLFPNKLSNNDDDDMNVIDAVGPGEQAWSGVKARKTGYVESIDEDSLLAWACDHRTIVRMECGIGEFVVEKAPLMSMSLREELDDEVVADLRNVYVIGRHRTVQQDVGFGVRQIVDIAIKALSPGVNDTTTAVMCVDYLGAILARLAVRQIARPRRLDKGEVRVIVRGPCFENLLAEAFDQVRQNAEGNVTVLTRQLHSLEIIASQTKNKRRRQALRQQGNLIVAVAERTVPSTHDSARVQAAAVALFRVLDGSG